MDEAFRWPTGRKVDLRDGLTVGEVVEALYAPQALQMDNRVPATAATLMAVCAPTEDQRLILVVCARTGTDEPWTIRSAREATMSERAMWRKYTS